MSDIDPREVLRDARQCVKSRDYAAALEKYIWFHDHALDVDRSFVGVRLSYAVSEWVDLGELYPPALTALEDVRDAKTSSLMKGDGDANLFHDVSSINRALGQVERTRDLFKIIAETNRGRAEKCFPAALESLVSTKEWSLARSFIPDARSEVDRFAMPFKSALTSTPSGSKEMKEDVFVRIYVKNVGLLLQVLIGIGDEVEARRARQYAIDCVTDEQVRDMVIERLSPSPPPTSVQ
jgi:hypothetical protein